MIDVIADGSCEAAGVTAWTAVRRAVLYQAAVAPTAVVSPSGYRGATADCLCRANQWYWSGVPGYRLMREADAYVHPRFLILDIAHVGWE